MVLWAKKDPQPRSLDEAQAMRTEEINRGVELERKLTSAKKGERGGLLEEHGTSRRRLRALNAWIKAHNIEHHVEWPIEIKTAVQAKALTVQEAAAIVAVDETSEPCACGAAVAPIRGATAWHFYCQRCGADWSRPAPALPARPRRAVEKRCRCQRRCATCGGAR